jgi:hypothetical protein
MYNNKFSFVDDQLIYGNLVQCSVKGKYLHNINCQYWNVDNNICSASCSLKNLENVSFQTCKTCTDRKSFKNKKIATIDPKTKKYIITDVNNSFLNTMRNKNKILQVDPWLAHELYKNVPVFATEVKDGKMVNASRVENSEKLVNKQSEIMAELIQNNQNNLVKNPSFIEKTKNYFKAESSQALLGKVSEKIFKKRKQICMACEFRISSAKNATDSIGWCKGGCGCSVGNPRAALSQKLYMPTLSCPKGKFGKEEGRGFSVEDAVDSGKGFFKSLASLIKGQKSDK